MTTPDTTGEQERRTQAREAATQSAEQMRQGTRETMQRLTEETRQAVAQAREEPTPSGLQAMIENLPAPVYLYATVGSIGLSLLLRTFGRKELANFVGLWPPTILALAMLNKQLRPSREM
ncbi:MAG: hypothetical protein C4290_15375 [Chloroflexota bacterium]